MDLLVSFVFAYYLDLASSIVSFLFVRIVDYFLYLYINKHTKKYFRELEILDDSLEIFFFLRWALLLWGPSTSIFYFEFKYFSLAGFVHLRFLLDQPQIQKCQCPTLMLG